MTKNKSPYTPRQVAYDIAIGWLRMAHQGGTDDLNQYNLGVGAKRNAIRQIAKLHNKLLDQSGLDGINIDEDQE